MMQHTYFTVKCHLAILQWYAAPALCWVVVLRAKQRGVFGVFPLTFPFWIFKFTNRIKEWNFRTVVTVVKDSDEMMILLWYRSSLSCSIAECYRSSCWTFHYARLSVWCSAGFQPRGIYLGSYSNWSESKTVPFRYGLFSRLSQMLHRCT